MLTNKDNKTQNTRGNKIFSIQIEIPVMRHKDVTITASIRFNTIFMKDLHVHE